jgi:hypothetical protein
MAAIPTLCIPMEEGTSCNDGQLFFKEEGQVLSYLYVMVKSISTLEVTKHMVVRFGVTGTTLLSRADDGSVDAVYRIHKGGNWLLVDNIACVKCVLVCLRMSLLLFSG